jgi:phosphoenolpyruvate carboxykinase (GTP)
VFGHSPRYEDLDWRGLDFGRGAFDKITAIDKAQWKREFELHAELFSMLAQGLPHHLIETKAALEKRLAA